MERQSAMGMLSRILGGGDESIRRARRPQELAASRGRPALEGLDWLGRRPGPRAPLLYRLLLSLGELILYRICAIRVEVDGKENLPPGGYVLAAALHRSWIDPLVVLRALPREPRPWFLGSAATAFDKRWKERLLHRTGGMLPVWRGGADVEVHVRAARAVVEEGTVLALFFEGPAAIVGPPDRVHSGVRAGRAEELYRGKRIGARTLPAVTVEELLGDEWPGRLPERNSREALRLARKITRRLAERIDGQLDELIALPRRRRTSLVDGAG